MGERGDGDGWNENGARRWERGEERRKTRSSTPALHTQQQSKPDAAPPTDADFEAAGLSASTRSAIAAFSYASFCGAADALAAESPGGTLPSTFPPLSPWQARHALLAVQAVPALDEVRYVLVPSRLSDAAFWAAYFRLARPLLPPAAFDPAAPAPAPGGGWGGGGGGGGEGGLPAAGLGARLGAWAAAAAAGGGSGAPPPSTSAAAPDATPAEEEGEQGGQNEEEEDDLDRYLAELGDEGEGGGRNAEGGSGGEGEGSGGDDLDAYLDELEDGSGDGDGGDGGSEPAAEDGEEEAEKGAGGDAPPPPPQPAEPAAPAASAEPSPAKKGEAMAAAASPVAVAASPAKEGGGDAA
jgi:hypothetical protein